MKLSELINYLTINDGELLELPIRIYLPDNFGDEGCFIQDHFHITEVGHVKKVFFDCGGIKRELNTCLLQVWFANNDESHRLKAFKLLRILDLTKASLNIADLEVEFEYSYGRVSQYVLKDIEFTLESINFILGNKTTDCLAPDKCGVSKKCCSDRSC